MRTCSRQAAQPIRKSRHPCEENGCTDWDNCDEICSLHPDARPREISITDVCMFEAGIEEGKRQAQQPDALAELLESPEYPEGVTLKLCECGNDTFRFIETADYLPEYEMWEGDEIFRICTKCGKNLGCLSDVKEGKSITRKALAAIRSKQGGRE